MFVNPNQIHSRIQIAFVHAQIDRNLLVTGDGRHPVDEKGLRHRVDIGREDGQGIHIGHGGPDKAAAAGQHGFHHSLAVFHGDFHQVPGQWGDMLLAQHTPAPADNRAVRQLHVIKPTQSPYNSSGMFLSHDL